MLILLPSDPLNSRLYSEWVRQFDSGMIEYAEELVATLVGQFRKTQKPGAFVDQIGWRAMNLPEAHRPWFWDMIGHWLSASVGDRYLGKRFRAAAMAAYGLARTAERKHSLPVYVDYHRENTLLFARAGALPVKEVTVYQRWLGTVGSAADAHHEFVRLLVALAHGGAALGADLHRRVRASAKAAGHGLDEDARVLRDVLAACTSAKVPNGLLDGATKVFAQTPVDDAALLLDLFPATATDGAALLRMLDAAGTIAGMADGTLTPARGLAGWIGRFFHMYSFVEVSYGGITKQQMPPELFAMIERIGPRLRESGERVAMSSGRYNSAYIDADLADALVSVGVGIDGPHHGEMHFWGAESQRDLVALAADPVLGPKLEATIHADDKLTRSAIARLPGNPGIIRLVHARISALIDRVAAGGLVDAELALIELDKLLDPPTAQALDGIEEALAALDGVGPLLHTIRAGIPDEFCWPALENAMAELGEVQGATSTWPLLTIYNADRALVIDPDGPVADATFTLPPHTTSHVVFYAGGDFLVGYTRGKGRPEEAFWTSAPGHIFTPAETSGMTPCRGCYDGGLGYQFAAPGGRHDGALILRPGDRRGIGECRLQLSDGARVWSYAAHRTGLDYWAEVDPTTGERAESASLPDFFAGHQIPDGKELARYVQSYARLPESIPDSPLGSTAGVVGYRITQDRRGRTGYLLEGIDGRRATYAGGQRTDDAWGVIRMPEGGADLLLTYGAWTDPVLIQAYDGERPVWEVRTLGDSPTNITADPALPPIFPPPAFWHFLTPRDAESSRVLRDLDTAHVKDLLSTGTLPPGIRDSTLAASVRTQAARASRLLRHRERISQRVVAIRSGEPG
ncbi:hypothetical protein ACFXO9_21060 [Nocardia tengchongensis]|uniref:hypothetical protein n=1 Tax=Nocardia tengchongensis TaxID=2055889 RepID=UPI0036BF9F15